MAGEGVTFVGSLDRGGVVDLLSRSRIVVIPSRIEPFGIVALEALAAGRRLVYARTGGLIEIAAGLGEPVDPLDEKSFIEALVRAVDSDIDPHLTRARAESYAWDKVSHTYERLLRRVSRRDR
jgi:glycosyltransferase involved in cell wall biosynthesis